MDTKERRPRASGGDRRRRFTAGYKRRMVEETPAEGASVLVVARRHGVNAHQISYPCAESILAKIERLRERASVAGY